MEPSVGHDLFFDVKRLVLLRQAVRCLLKHGVHQKELAQRAEIAPYQVRNFVKAKTENPRPNLEHTVRPLYDCLAGYEHMIIPAECRELIMAVKNAGKARDRFGAALHEMVSETDVSPDDDQKVCNDYAGSYMCFRYSAWQGHVAVSALNVLDGRDDSIARFRHVHTTRDGKERCASGYIFPMAHTLFFVGQMPGRIGLETLALIREDRSLLNGLILLPSNRRTPIAANIVCRGVDRIDHGELGVFAKEDAFARMTDTEIRAISNQSEETGVLRIY